jgi:oxygen-independent coproporphyrinogen-3 oxidase
MSAHTPVAPKVEPVTGNYFVAVYPPFFAWQPAQKDGLEEILRKEPAPAPIGLYVHLPFCQKKCDYCYYLSYVGQKPEAVERYLDALLGELALYAERPAVRGRPISFVYFGGGTPSMLTLLQVRGLIRSLRAIIPWNQVEEVTFECAPRSVRRDFLQTLRELGVTRLSMGVQSFDDTLLRLNGRVHLEDDVLRAYAQIRQTEFDWVNLDLMVGLIGETWESWKRSVRQIIKLSPESVTLYQTEIPHNTQLYADLNNQRLAAPVISWTEKRERLSYAFSELDRAGYTIVSAYSAVKNPRCHSFKYQKFLWRGGDMLGLGVASFGYLGGAHFQNQVTLERYEAEVEAGNLPIKRAFLLDTHARLVREFILQLKWGEVSAAKFRRRFSVDILQLFERPLRNLAAEGFLTLSSGGVRLTEAGLLSVDRLLPQFYDSEFQNSPYA